MLQKSVTRRIADIARIRQVAECDVFGNFEGDESPSFASKNPAQAVPGNHAIRATLQPATTSIAFLFRNHTLWDLNNRTSNALESQHTISLNRFAPTSVGIRRRRLCRFFFRSDSCPNQGLFGNSGQDESTRPRYQGSRSQPAVKSDDVSDLPAGKGCGHSPARTTNQRSNAIGRVSSAYCKRRSDYVALGGG